jgi:formylglycine-generating enzyme required for sulfatase activity
MLPDQVSTSPLSTHTFVPTAIPTTATLAPSLTATIVPSITRTPTITPLPTSIIDDYGVPMVLVPAGSFVMGRNDRAPNESPAHSVTLDDYYIDQFEATNLSFAEFLNVMGNQFEGNAHWIEVNDPDLRIHLVGDRWQVDEGFENYPMNEVTWYGARAYCSWRDGRLPSEAEWEKAARGTDERTFPWGEEISCDLANYAGCVYGAVPVDSYPEGISPYGVYNMAGNVMEWVADWYDREYYQHSPAENPTGPEIGDFKIFRGGSWFNAAGNVRTTYRFAKLQVLTYVANGFRCARDVQP